MLLSLMLALPGLFMMGPMATVVALYAERERKKALAGSDVKVKATDVMASVKVMASLIFYPFYCGFFTFIFYEICRVYLEFSRTKSIELSIFFMIVFPIYAMSKQNSILFIPF